VIASDTDRHGTELVLESWGHRVTGGAASPEAALDLIAKRRPQVAVVGADLPEGRGPSLVRRLRAAHPSLGLVLVLEGPSLPELEEAMAAGANGLVLQGGTAIEFANAVSAAGELGRYVAPAVERRARDLA
jgi:DNA-binding NarL/FixJ family response regulator